MDAARGESCTLNLPAVCKARSETVVFAHHNDGTGGSNRLTGPLTGGFACFECHQVLDGHVQAPAWIKDDMEFYKRRSMIRTVNRLLDLEVISL